jgi:hypothetical protein
MEMQHADGVEVEVEALAWAGTGSGAAHSGTSALATLKDRRLLTASDFLAR